VDDTLGEAGRLLPGRKAGGTLEGGVELLSLLAGVSLKEGIGSSGDSGSGGGGAKEGMGIEPIGDTGSGEGSLNIGRGGKSSVSGGGSLNTGCGGIAGVSTLGGGGTAGIEEEGECRGGGDGISPKLLLSVM